MQLRFHTYKEGVMKFRICLLSVVVFALAAGASAQTKISGTANCAKPDPLYKIEVGDQPNHAYSIHQVKCTWTKPLVIAGLKTKEDVVTVFAEVTGSSAKTHAFVVGAMENGDKVHVRPQGKDTLKDGMTQTGEGTWGYVGGTGKLKGIKGKGTYKCKPGVDGTMTCQVEGEYELPKK